MKAVLFFLAKLVCGTLVLCALGPFAVNLLFVSTPITLQSLIIILVPVMIGWQAGLLSIILYLLLGAAGLPVFANFNSGLAAFTGTSAGFLLGFPLVGCMAGWWSTRVIPVYPSFLIIFLGCHVLLLAFGTAGFLLADLSAQTTASTLVGLLPGLLIKSLLGALLALYLHQRSAWQKRIATAIRTGF